MFVSNPVRDKVTCDTTRAASGGALAPEPPRTIVIKPEFILIMVQQNPGFPFYAKSDVPDIQSYLIPDVWDVRVRFHQIGRIRLCDITVQFQIWHVRLVWQAWGLSIFVWFGIGRLRRPILEKQGKNTKKNSVHTPGPVGNGPGQYVVNQVLANRLL